LSQYDSQFEENLYQLRRDKLAQIAALVRAANPALTDTEAKYPNTFAFTSTLPELRAIGDPLSTEDLAELHIEAAIAGRIMAIRVQGKAGFAQLQQGGQRLQIYVRKDDVGEDQFNLYKLLDLGDHIGVRGYLMRTRTGELTLHAAPITLPGDEASSAAETPAVRAALTLLTKAMLALPDKYHGLEDVELRYRQRYVDLIMNSGHSPKPSTEPNPVTPNEAVAAAKEDSVILSERSESKDPDAANPATTAQPLSTTQAHALKGTGFSPSVQPPAEEGALAPEGISPETPNVRETFVKRAAILRSIRHFFDHRGYLEVETPMLHTIAGGAAARPFKTHHNALDIGLSLRIAPELYLKRLVVGGLDRVYEINRNFRNEGVSTQHNPEFTMLEFYQAYANYHDLMDLTQNLITTVAQEVNGTTLTNFNGTEIDLSRWTKLSMREAIITWWPDNFTNDFGPIPTFEELSSLDGLRTTVLRVLEAAERGMNYAHQADPEAIPTVRLFTVLFREMLKLIDKDQNWGKPISILFEFVSERFLIQPTIIYDFPLAVSPLSKVKPNEPDWVERFEFYIGGFEVGNAFSELNDPDDQLRRFEAQLEDRKRGDVEAMTEVDEDYVRALGYGLPPTAGEGIGIDRLTMILTGSRSIRDVILFPLMRPHKPTPTEDPTNPNHTHTHGESAE
jgi:lysyl-tRNA synthetase, class II